MFSFFSGRKAPEERGPSRSYVRDVIPKYKAPLREVRPILSPYSRVRDVVPVLPAGMLPAKPDAQSGGGGAGPRITLIQTKPGRNIPRQFIPPFVISNPVGHPDAEKQLDYNKLAKLEGKKREGLGNMDRLDLLGYRYDLIHSNVDNLIKKYDISLFSTTGYRGRSKYPEYRGSNKDHILFIPTQALEDFDPEISPRLTHAVSIIDKGDHIEYYDPHGKPYDARHPSVNFHVSNFANAKPIRCNEEVMQGNIGACEAYSTLKHIHPEMSNEMFNHYIKQGADRLGVTNDNFVMYKVDQYARTQREFAHYPPASFKKGGLVTVAKETYSKTPEDVGDYKLVKKTPTMLIYQKGDHYVVGVRGTQDLEDVKADTAIPFGIKNTSRFKKDEKTLREWKRDHPGSYTGVGHSLGGAILDELINDGLLESATSYNPAMGTETGKNKRIYAEHDPLRTIGKADQIVKTKHSIIGQVFPVGRAIESHSLNNFPDTEEMRHQITEVPLVEKRRLGGDKGMQKQPGMKSGGVVEKVKKVAKKVKEVAEHVGREVVKEAKKHSHHLKNAGKAAGSALGTAGGAAAATAVGAPEAAGLASTIGSAMGSKLGEFLGEKAHEGIQSLKKGGKVRKLKGKLQEITDTKPVEHKKAVRSKKPAFKEGGEVKPAAKKPSAWMAHVKAYHAKHGGSYKDAMKSAKATYKV